MRVARLTRTGLIERAKLDERSDALAASILDPLDDAERAELVSAMRTVERLLARSVIELRQVDPASPDAQRCLRAYVAELNRRAPERGFDPSTGATVDPHEVRPPNGRSFSPTFRARRSAAAPSSTNRTTCLTSSACGSRNQREVWGSVAGSSSISGAPAVSTHQTKHTRNQQRAAREAISL